MNHRKSNNSENLSFSRAMISLHWLMLALFVATYASIELRHLFHKGTDYRELMKTLHFMIGMCVLLMAGIRIWFKFRAQTPPISPAPPAWQEWMAKLTHIALYAFMIGMPLLGWLSLSAAGKPIPFFGFELPALMGTDKQFAKQLNEIHEIVGIAGYFLIGAHAVAALFHHYVVQDNTFKRMSLKNLSVTRSTHSFQG